MKKKALSILYVGALGPTGSIKGFGYYSVKNLRSLHSKVTVLDMYPEKARRLGRNFSMRVMRKIVGPLDLGRINKKIITIVKERNFDVVWILRGQIINPGTLKKVRELCPDCTIVGHSLDDIWVHKLHRTKRALRSTKYYDVVFTNKSYALSKIRELGCPNAVFMGNTFESEMHGPVEISSEDRKKYGGSIGFIGHYEPHYGKWMRILVSNGIPVRIWSWGYGWGNSGICNPNLKDEGRAVLGEEYAKSICSFDINLCFLSKWVNDKQTKRSVEIPACGAFMLAERTDEHLELFEEGKEAEFFSSKEEILEKVKYYLAHPKERRKIAAAGSILSETTMRATAFGQNRSFAEYWDRAEKGRCMVAKSGLASGQRESTTK